MAEARLGTIRLTNHLVMEILDASRRMASDRWMVICAVQVEIETEPYRDAVSRTVGFDQVRAVLGDRAVFRKEASRCFVDDRDRESTRDDLCDSLVKSLQPYLSRPDFPEKFILKEYGDRVRRAAVPRAPT